jgi:hypothetical protein
MWNVVLSEAEANSLYHAGLGEEVDWSIDSGSYTSSADLQHWWRLGEKRAAIGVDSPLVQSRSLGSINLDAASGITTDDIVPDYPGLPPQEDLQSISFNGTDEDLFNDTPQTIGVANDWSIQALCEPAALTASSMTIFNIRGSSSSTVNNILMSILAFDANDPLSVRITSSSGVLIKRYDFESHFTVGVKVSVLCTWNGTNLITYIDGTLATPTTLVTDDSGTMSDLTGRKVAIGSRQGEGVPQSFFEGKTNSVSVWDTVLTQAQVTVLENSGSPHTFDNRVDSGAYNASANLVHYWRLGEDSDDIGKDSGTGTAINVGDDALNMTADDRVVY